MLTLSVARAYGQKISPWFDVPQNQIWPEETFTIDRNQKQFGALLMLEKNLKRKLRGIGCERYLMCDLESNPGWM